MVYVENSKLIHSLNELPKIGASKILYNPSICISIEPYEDDRYKDYLFYKVKYLNCDKFISLDCDTFVFNYAIKKENVFAQY